MTSGITSFYHTGLAAKVRPAKRLDLEEFKETFKQYEKEFNEYFESGKWKDIAEHEFKLEECQINELNEAYKEGLSPFWEKLSEFSAWTKEDVEALIEGAKDPGKERFFGLIEPSEENKKLSREAEAYLKKTYARLARTDVPDSYDAREYGNLNIISYFFKFLEYIELFCPQDSLPQSRTRHPVDLVLLLLPILSWRHAWSRQVQFLMVWTCLSNKFLTVDMTVNA